MDFDDDAPPDLVGADVEPGDESEEKPVKVPITIVTGESERVCILGRVRVLTDSRRLSWSGQDHVAQLHPDGRARQEDSRHHER
jgi:hypothetical protein